MKNSNTAFITTVFPAAEKYLDDFFISLQRQYHKDFDVLVVNDGIEDLEKYCNSFPDLNIVEIDPSSSIAGNRERGTNKALEMSYDFLIFGDADDHFSENRVGESIKALKTNDIVVNKLISFHEDGSKKDFFSDLIYDNDPFGHLYEGNIFGFSHIAVCADSIVAPVSFNDKLIAVDWFFVTLLNMQGIKEVGYLKDAHTFYRQYGDNTIGSSGILDDQSLIAGLEVKMNHYNALIDHCNERRMSGQIDIFRQKLTEMEEVKIKISDSHFRKTYIDLVNSNIKEIFTGWWSNIITLDEFRKYEGKT